MHQKPLSPEHKLWCKFQYIVLSEAKQGLKGLKNNFQASALRAGQRFEKAHFITRMFIAGNANEHSFQSINICWYMSEARHEGVISTQSLSVYIYLYRFIWYRFLFLWRKGPTRFQTASFLRFLDKHTRYYTSKQVIGLSQRPRPSQHTINTTDE
jgi:hypothetical protein